MDYCLKPTLQNRALIKVATTLWSQDDIKGLFSKFYFPRPEDKEYILWQDVEDQVIKNVETLPIGRLKGEVLRLIKPIGLQILSWMHYHVRNHRFDANWIKELCWTPYGTVDKKKTAELLVREQHLDIINRYKLACIYCLEDDIRFLWNEMPESCRTLFFREEDPLGIDQSELVIIWTYGINGKSHKLTNMIEEEFGTMTPYEYAFTDAVIRGNEAAAKYFFDKLTPEARNKHLDSAACFVAGYRWNSIQDDYDFPKACYSDVLVFLLSQMNEIDKETLFKCYPSEVLQSFLYWPWQSLFLETAELVIPFLSQMEFIDLLKVIVGKVISGYDDFNYQELFSRFWQLSPLTHKQFVLMYSVGETILQMLLRVEDTKNISLIFKSATSDDKEKFIYSRSGRNIYQTLVHWGNRNLLDFFVGECISSPEKRICFEEELNSAEHRSKGKKRKIRNTFYFGLHNFR